MSFIQKSTRLSALAQKIYKKWGVLQNETYPEKNTWNVRIRTPFNMSNDSGMFKTL
jgi:hypothetical protein